MPKKPKPPKKCNGLAHVLEKKANGKEIEEDTEGAADAVVALAGLTIDVADGNFADGSPIPTCKSRDEAVHLAIERDVLDDLAAIGLEGGAKVVNIDAGELCHEPIGAARGDAAHDEVVNAFLAPSGDDVVALFELFDEGGDVVRVVLQVAVHGEDELAGGMIETGGQRRGLAEVAAQLDDEDAAVYRGNLFEEFVGAVP